MRGRRPTPTALKLLRGQKSKDASLEPRPPAGTPDCPQELDDSGKRHWYRLAAVLTPMGCLTIADSVQLQMLCAALARYDRATAKLTEEGEVVFYGQSQACNPWLKVLREAESTIDRISGKFGLTPTDRARIKVGGTGQRKDDLGDFLRETA